MQRVAVRASFDAIAIAIVGLALAIHAASSGALDFFRDELYFIACGATPQWGYVDQPALVPLLARAAYVLAGGNVLWFRALPALVHGATVVAAMALAGACGGGRFARALAGLSVALAPVYLAFGWLFTTNTFEPLCWTLVVLAVVRASRDPRWFALAGLALGFSLETKYGLLVDMPGLEVGLACSPLRRYAREPAFWGACLLAAVIASPGIVWQWTHGFPMLELLKNDAAGGKDVVLSFGGYLASQVALLAPFGAIVVLAGLVWPVVDRNAEVGRIVAVGWVVTFGVLVTTHGKDYYFAAAHVPALAAGAVALERVVRRLIARAATLAFGFATIVFAPLAVPLGGVAGYVAVSHALHVAPAASESTAQSSLPQTFADTFGWRDFARAVDARWRRLPPSQRAHAAVWVTNYGEAAALDVFARRPDLHVISTHNQYWLRGPGPWDGSVALLVRRVGDVDRAACAALADLGPVAMPADAMPYERTRHIYACRGLRRSVAAVWAAEKTYY